MTFSGGSDKGSLSEIAFAPIPDPANVGFIRRSAVS